jgi:hypothetical protein
MVPLLKVVRESLEHDPAAAELDDVFDDVLSTGAQAVAVASPKTASIDTRLETLRMGGIIAHPLIARQHSGRDDLHPFRGAVARAPLTISQCAAPRS